MNWKAKWIKSAVEMGEVCPRFGLDFRLSRHDVSEATLYVTAHGSFFAHLNGVRLGDEVMNPGWTSYRYRLQYMSYDVTCFLKEENTISAVVGNGWYRSHLTHTAGNWHDQNMKTPAALLAQLEIVYENGDKEIIFTDEHWSVSESEVRSSTLYDGEELDATFCAKEVYNAVTFEEDMSVLIPQEGEPIRETAYIVPRAVFTTPNGETVVDFGQNVTGYVQITVDACAGEKILLSHGEVLDKDGNFYNANYRAAKAVYRCTCAQGEHVYKPLLTFYGFRYVRLDVFPGTPSVENFMAIAVHSDMKKTITFDCSSQKLNHLFQNILWGQRDNFLDVPTDCPQRDERLGWTGDAQVFVQTACYNYDAERFFTKWLRDMRVDQLEDGRMPHIIPALFNGNTASAAWGDAATICPWTVYMMYGNPILLREQFGMMKKWVDFITNDTKDAYLWTGGSHYGDWLGLDAPSGSYKGSSREDLIASAYYAYSTSLVIKAGEALGEDVTSYVALYKNIVKTFRDKFDTYQTQTECALAVHFRLASDLQATADQLAEMVSSCGHLQTGFVGTPYLLHALSDFGHWDLAYTLLLREEYPSWLYAVNHGATTMWEHWDGVMEDGSFWSTDMNSFNHYAYGAVADWIYGKAAGITPTSPGFARVRIAPKPDARLDWMRVGFDSRYGKIVSAWRKFEGGWRFEIETPVEAEILIDGKMKTVAAGSYVFFADGCS